MLQQTLFIFQFAHWSLSLCHLMYLYYSFPHSLCQTCQVFRHQTEDVFSCSPLRHPSLIVQPIHLILNEWCNTSKDYTQTPLCSVLVCPWEGESVSSGGFLVNLYRLFTTFYFNTIKHVTAELPGPEGKRIRDGGSFDYLGPLGCPEVHRLDGRTTELASL